MLLLSADAHAQALNLVQGFATLRIGAGGAVRGIDVECDQGLGKCMGSGTTTKVVRTDTYGAYWFNPAAPNPGNAGGLGSWQQLVTHKTLPSNDPTNAPTACHDSSVGCGVL